MKNQCSSDKSVVIIITCETLVTYFHLPLEIVNTIVNRKSVNP